MRACRSSRSTIAFSRATTREVRFASAIVALGLGPILTVLWPRASRAHEEASPTPVASSALVITGDKPVGASADEARGRDLTLRPRFRPADVLSIVPGLFAVQHAGGGKANQYFLRGFDADHGTDVAVFVDGVPVNMPSHAHGQGWIDLHFLIPELVAGLSWTKGAYTARHGDFATAGAVEMRLADHVHESAVTLQSGSFGTARGLFLVSPELGDDWSTLLAGEVYATDGPFANKERFKRLNLFGRVTRRWGAGSLAITWMSYAGGWNASGQIPARAVGKIPELPNELGAIDPTDGGSTQRHQASVAYAFRKDDDEARALLYAIRYRFELFSNFTFFARDPANGDQIDQSDARTVAGTHWYFRRTRRVGSMSFASTVGITARHDDIDNGLAATRARALLSTMSAAAISQTAVGVYAEEDARLLAWLRVVLGVRFDRMDVAVRGTTNGIAGDSMVSPKLALVSSPAPFLDLFLDYGRGFHSNDGRAAVGGTTLLAKAETYETGARVRLFDRRLDLSAALFRIDLDSETVWVGDEGTTEARGPTRRVGVELGARAKLASWLWADLDATFARAVFVENAGNGNAVALAPTRTLTAGLMGRHPSGVFGTFRVRSIGARPATEDRTLTADGWTVFEASLGYRYRFLEGELDVRNLFDVGWREVQFGGESRLANEPAPVRDLHYTPGWPFTVLARGTVYF